MWAVLTRAVVVIFPPYVDRLVITVVATSLFVASAAPFSFVIVGAMAIDFASAALIVVVPLVFTLKRPWSLNKLVRRLDTLSNNDLLWLRRLPDDDGLRCRRGSFLDDDGLRRGLGEVLGRF